MEGSSIHTSILVRDQLPYNLLHYLRWRSYTGLSFPDREIKKTKEKVTDLKLLLPSSFFLVKSGHLPSIYNSILLDPETVEWGLTVSVFYYAKVEQIR